MLLLTNTVINCNPAAAGFYGIALLCIEMTGVNYLWLLYMECISKSRALQIAMLSH